jgi:hypothetical protein
VDFNTGDAVCLCRKIRGEKKAAPGKYHVSRPSAEYNGVFHDSKFEAETAMSLDWQLKAKEIKGWVRQFPIEIRSPRSDLNPAAQGGLPHRELREHTFSRTAERGV